MRQRHAAPGTAPIAEGKKYTRKKHKTIMKMCFSRQVRSCTRVSFVCFDLINHLFALLAFAQIRTVKSAEHEASTGSNGWNSAP
jgi:mannose/cellobiose epimerase-like protein (N-acyl-D-glucosamine 2-epimerase family)